MAGFGLDEWADLLEVSSDDHAVAELHQWLTAMGAAVETVNRLAGIAADTGSDLYAALKHAVLSLDDATDEVSKLQARFRYHERGTGR